MSGRVLILGGSGKIGTHAAEAFWNRSWTIRIWDRSADDMTAAARGADVIVNGLNPPNYHDWERQIPRITEQVIEAARATGATVILPGNVYNFGNAGGTWSEATPQRPVTRKGRIRVAMEAAYRAAGVRTIVLRAGTFIDPHHNGDMMTLFHLRALGGGYVTAGGPPDVEQAWCYLPDWARAAEMLAERREFLERFEDVPFPGHAFSIAELRGMLELEIGQSLRISAFPWRLLQFAAPFWELARELGEMRYLHETPHRLDRSKFDRLLPGFAATDLREVVRALVPARSSPSSVRQVDPDKPVRSRCKAILTE